MNTARPFGFLVGSALLLVGMDSHALAQTPPAPRNLSASNRELFDQCIAELRDNVETWRTIAQTRPGEPIWNRLADETEQRLTRLAATPVVESDLASWWTGGPGALAAYHQGTIYLDDDFGNAGVLVQSQKRWDYLERTDPKEYHRQREELRQSVAGCGSVLAHEAIHADGNRSERDAYLFQYRYLVASDVQVTSDEMYKVQEQLVALGMMKKIGKTKRLDKELGLEPVKKFHKEQALRMQDMEREPTDSAADPEPKRRRRNKQPKLEEKPDPRVDPPKLGQPHRPDWNSLERRAKRLGEQPGDDQEDANTRPVIPAAATIDVAFANPDALEYPYCWSFYIRGDTVTGSSKTHIPASDHGDHGAEEFTCHSKFSGSISENVMTGILSVEITPIISWGKSKTGPWRYRTTSTWKPNEMTVTFSGDGTAALAIAPGIQTAQVVALQGPELHGEIVTNKLPAEALNGAWQYRGNQESD